MTGLPASRASLDDASRQLLASKDVAVREESGEMKLYVTGGFSGSVQFGGVGLQSRGGNDIFVAKMSGSRGTFEWAKQFGGPGNDYGRAVDVDRSGGVYVVGDNADGAVFGTQTLTVGSYVAKLDNSGTYQWVKQIVGPYAEADGVAVDNGTVYVAGWFLETTDFDAGTETEGDTLTSRGKEDSFSARYDATTGSLSAAQRSGGSGTDRRWDIAADPGFVYAVGRTNSDDGDFPARGVANPASAFVPQTTNGAVSVLTEVECRRTHRARGRHLDHSRGKYPGHADRRHHAPIPCQRLHDRMDFLERRCACARWEFSSRVSAMGPISFRPLPRIPSGGSAWPVSW